MNRCLLVTLLQDNFVLAVGEFTEFYRSGCGHVVGCELGLALVVAQIHGTAGLERYEVRAVEAENRVFVRGAGRCFQLPFAGSSAVCRDVARAVVRLDAEEVTTFGQVESKRGLVSISREQILHISQFSLAGCELLESRLGLFRYIALAEGTAERLVEQVQSLEAIVGSFENIIIRDVFCAFNRPS